MYTEFVKLVSYTVQDPKVAKKLGGLLFVLSGLFVLNFSLLSGTWDIVPVAVGLTCVIIGLWLPNSKIPYRP